MEESIELTLNTNGTFERLQEAHDSMLKLGHNNDNISDELIQIMGGIDNILSHYLSNKNSDLLNKSQIQLIHQSLSVNIQQYQSNEPKSESNIPTETDKTYTSDGVKFTKQSLFTEIFEPHNTVLNHLFGSNIGPKIQQVIYHKIAKTISAVMLLYAILSVFVSIPEPFGTIFAYIGIIYFILWLIPFIMTVNRTALYLISRSFEFWFKIFYAVFLCALKIIAERNRTKDTWFDTYILLSIDELLVIALFSITDGLQWSLKSKFIIGVIIAIYYSLCAFFGEFFWTERDDTIIEISDTISVQLRSMIASAYRVLAIFIWKQTISSVWKKRRATIIKYSPYIKWVSTRSSVYNVNPSFNSNQDYRVPLLS
eukprot:417975_1